MTAPPELAQYATIIFDCDGVLLDSNRVKTDAFREVALVYGEHAAERLVEHHKRHGGVSRNEKFRYLVETIVGRPPRKGEVEALVSRYALAVGEALVSCNAADGLELLRKRTPRARWMIVSGGAQDELKDVFKKRGLADLFDAGIHGSPASKDQIFERLIAEGALQAPAVYLGDSRYDHESARRVGLDFIFVSGWTEFRDWQAYCGMNGIPVISAPADLIGGR